MPSFRPMRECNWQGCRKVVATRYCGEHQADIDIIKQQEGKKYDKKRGSSYERGYNAQWRKIRKLKLYHEPLCEQCLAINQLDKSATIVHHINKNAKDNRDENLMSLCNNCHEEIHKGDRYGKR